DRDELVEQPVQKFDSMLGISVARDQGKYRASRMMQVVVGSIQTLCRQDRLERYPRDHFQYIFVDEAHRHVEQAKAIREYFRNAKACGQTATAFRANLKDLSAYYDTVAYELGLFDLIEAGYITPLKVLTLPVQVDISDVRMSKIAGENDFRASDLDTKI